ncbi:MAG: hypothetical protein LBG59_05845 [Candidatus Peribacteria bacterium]|nr:hypothetical protein [Candidatus Peribacteria bacterium]
MYANAEIVSGADVKTFRVI